MVIEDLIRKVFPEYKSKRELLEEIQIVKAQYSEMKRKARRIPIKLETIMCTYPIPREDIDDLEQMKKYAAESLSSPLVDYMKWEVHDFDNHHFVTLVGQVLVAVKEIENA